VVDDVRQIVGREGSGTLNVLGGALLSIASPNGTFPGFNVGRSEGSSGVVNVSGNGSSITVDGSQPAAILTSNEGDMRRYPVDCRKGQLGSFPMAAGVEYYLPAIGTLGGAEIDLEVYPGTRTNHAFNDVSCIASSEGGNAATFRISGFYTVRTHDFGERRVVEFRPALGRGVSRQAAAACLE